MSDSSPSRKYLLATVEAFASDTEGLTLDAATWNRMRAAIESVLSETGTTTPPQCCYGGRMNALCVRQCVHAHDELWKFIDELNAAPQAPREDNSARSERVEATEPAAAAPKKKLPLGEPCPTCGQDVWMVQT